MRETTLLKQTGRGLAGLALGLGLMGLTGCMGGTTWGTGVSQESQTLSDFYNMFSLSPKKQAKIDYKPRPDLVVPADKQALPEPLDAASSTTEADWPETPEQRIARIRGEAKGDYDERGNRTVASMFRKKDGISVETEYNAPGDMQAANVGGHDGNHYLQFQQAGLRKEVKRLKAETGVAAGTQRRYLTEPPIDYRKPAETAPTGQAAYTEEQLAERKNAEDQAKREEMKRLSTAAR